MRDVSRSFSPSFQTARPTNIGPHSFFTIEFVYPTVMEVRMIDNSPGGFNLLQYLIIFVLFVRDGRFFLITKSSFNGFLLCFCVF